MATAKSSLITFANKTKKDLFDNYIRLGLKASGEYGESLDYKVDITSKGYSVKMYGAKQGLWIEEGRRPNKDQSTAAVKKLYPIILQWANNKGIQATNIKQFAYLSARKIVMEGWRVPNQHNKGGVITNVINDQWLQDGVEAAGGALISEITSSILTQFKKKL